MKYFVNWILVLGIILLIFFCTYPSKIDHTRGNPVFLIAGLIFILCGILTSRNANRIAKKREIELTEILNKKLLDKDREIKSRERKLEEEQERIKLKTENVLKVANSSSPFILASSLASDMKTYIYEEAAFFLINKQRPAYKAAEILKEMREKMKIQQFESTQVKYRLETLLSIFPELEKYLDNDEGVIELSKYSTLEDFNDKRDRVSDYLTKEEYTKLTIDERNQLALDRYIKRPKSSWHIGIEYEQYIEYLLRENGFFTIPFGSNMGLHDLGRDVIAKKQINGECVTYIIQCKNWSRKKKKEIHENIICQTFGTALEYSISNGFKERVIPVIVSTVPLSYVAKKFAEKLNVKYYIVLPGIPPLIKCNINNSGQKIYHLPFDQQYFRTEIKNEGEFYAFTVKEATSKGFRRAMRHYNL